MTGTFEEIIDTGLLDHLAGVYDGDAICVTCEHAEIVRNQDQAKIQPFAQISEYIHDLRLDSDVKGCCRFIRDEEIGIIGDSHGDHDTLAHPAGKFMRELVKPPIRLWNGDKLQQFGGSAHGGFFGNMGVVQQDRLGDLCANCHDRIKGRERILEYYGDSGTAQLPKFPHRHPDQFLPLESRGTLNPRRFSMQAQGSQHAHGFSRSGFADDAKNLSMVHME